MTALFDPWLTISISILFWIVIGAGIAGLSVVVRMRARIDRIERRFKDDNERLTQTQRTLDLERHLRIELLKGVNSRISSIVAYQKGQHRAMRALRRERSAKERCSSILGFTQYRFPRYRASGVHRLVCSHLERVEAREIDRLMLLMPPRHGKSELASKSYPAWCIGRNPGKQFISGSASMPLAQDWGREVRNIVGSDAYQLVFETRLSPDSQAAGKWNTQQGGSYYSVGVEGGVMGRGAHDVLLDDLYANMEEASSPVIREKVWKWYSGTIYNRDPRESFKIIMLWPKSLPQLSPQGIVRIVRNCRQLDNGPLVSIAVPRLHLLDQATRKVILMHTVIDQNDRPVWFKAGKWNTQQGGSYFSAGVESNVMGRGAHDILLDDLYGKMEEAASPKIRRVSLTVAPQAVVAAPSISCLAAGCSCNKYSKKNQDRNIHSKKIFSTP